MKIIFFLEFHNPPTPLSVKNASEENRPIETDDKKMMTPNLLHEKLFSYIFRNLNLMNFLIKLN